jgi:cytoskeletal protein CcmA (bactofilin family)
VIEQGAIFEGNCRMLQVKKSVESKPEPVQNKKNEPKAEPKASQDTAVQPSPPEANGSNVTRIAS